MTLEEKEKKDLKQYDVNYYIKTKFFCKLFFDIFSEKYVGNMKHH